MDLPGYRAALSLKTRDCESVLFAQPHNLGSRGIHILWRLRQYTGTLYNHRGWDLDSLRLFFGSRPFFNVAGGYLFLFAARLGPAFS